MSFHMWLHLIFSVDIWPTLLATVYTKFFWASPDILTSSPDIWLNLTVALRRTFSVFAGLVRHVRRTSCRLLARIVMCSSAGWRLPVGLVHLWTDQRFPNPVSCRCPEPRVVCWRPHLGGTQQYVSKIWEICNKMSGHTCLYLDRSPSNRSAKLACQICPALHTAHVNRERQFII